MHNSTLHEHTRGTGGGGRWVYAQNTQAHAVKKGFLPHICIVGGHARRNAHSPHTFPPLTPPQHSPRPLPRTEEYDYQREYHFRVRSDHTQGANFVLQLGEEHATYTDINTRLELKRPGAEDRQLLMDDIAVPETVVVRKRHMNDSDVERHHKYMKSLRWDEVTMEYVMNKYVGVFLGGRETQGWLHVLKMKVVFGSAFNVSCVLYMCCHFVMFVSPMRGRYDAVYRDGEEEEQLQGGSPGPPAGTPPPAQQQGTPVLQMDSEEDEPGEQAGGADRAKVAGLSDDDDL